MCELCNTSLPALPAPPPPKKPRNSSTKKQDTKKAPPASEFFKPKPTPSRQITPADFFKPAAPAPAKPSAAQSSSSATAASAPSVAAAAAAAPVAAHAAPPAAAASAASGPADELTLPLVQYGPLRAGWRPGAPVPYSHVAAALEAVEATRSRLAKELILTNAFRAALALQASAECHEAMCYLLAPTKDAQTGGHRIRPDWSPDSAPLGLTSTAIRNAVLETSGASRAQFSAAYKKSGDSGSAALSLRECGGRQTLLLQPQPLTAAGVLKTLRALPSLSGTGAESRKSQRLASLLRAARGVETKWLVRTFLPHMSAGISLEASVLTAMGGAAAVEGSGGAGSSSGGGGSGGSSSGGSGGGIGGNPLPSAVTIKQAHETVRDSYALRPDVAALVAALLHGGIASVPLACCVQPGVPPQPMLAKPCNSIEGLLKSIVAAATASATASSRRASPSKHGAQQSAAGEPPAGVRATIMVAAEHKYDGQRAQVHRTPDGTVRLFSRKLDEMTYKYATPLLSFPDPNGSSYSFDLSPPHSRTPLSSPHPCAGTRRWWRR